MSLPLDVLILGNEDPSEFAQLAEYGYVIGTTRKNFRDVSDRLAEFLEGPHNRRADVLVEKERQGAGKAMQPREGLRTGPQLGLVFSVTETD
jgi:hypothetical protein